MLFRSAYFETFHQQSDAEIKRDGYDPSIGVWVYKADEPDYPTIPGSWASPLYMPESASRIHLEITGIKAQRVQDITEEGAKAEGIKVLPLQDESDPSAWYQYAPGIFQARSAIKSYELLWDSLNAKRGYPWESNPWVWVVSFKVVQGC